MAELKSCPFCGEYLVRTQNSYTNKHGEKCKEDYYSHDVLKNPEYCLAEEICVGNNLKDITAWNTRPGNWISIKDRTPKNGDYVLCVSGHSVVQIALYDTSVYVYGFYANSVTHWMPLPEPPKGDEN